MKAHLFLILAVFFNIAANIIYKTISGRIAGLGTSLLFFFGLAMGGINVFFLTGALKHIELNVAYPVFSSSSIALMALVGSVIFHERMSPVNIGGICVIILGLVLVTR